MNPGIGNNNPLIPQPQFLVLVQPNPQAAVQVQVQNVAQPLLQGGEQNVLPAQLQAVMQANMRAFAQNIAQANVQAYMQKAAFVLFQGGVAQGVVQQQIQVTLTPFYLRWMQNANQAKNFAVGQVYNNNANVPLMLGKAQTLLENYLERAKVNVQAANTAQSNPFFYYGSLAAARKVDLGKCYCTIGNCAENVNCTALTNLFGIAEITIKTVTDQILKATYGGSTKDIIQGIRDRLRKNKIP